MAECIIDGERAQQELGDWLAAFNDSIKIRFGPDSELVPGMFLSQCPEKDVSEDLLFLQQKYQNLEQLNVTQSKESFKASFEVCFVDS